MTDEDWVRAALEDAVRDVEPGHALDTIQARTSSAAPRRRGWTWAAGGAAVGVAATLVAIAALNNPAGTNHGEPAPLGTPTTSQASPARTAAAPVYYLGDTAVGPRLFREFHQVTAAADLAQPALVEATSRAPIDPDYSTPWLGLGATVEGVEHTPDLITVDLGGPDSLADRPEGMAEDVASLAVEQLMFTVQGALQSTNSVPVQFLLNGAHAPSLLGVPVSEPLSAADPLSVQGTVWIIDPQDGDTITSGDTVTGRGAFFEATVSWQLLDDDTVVRSGFTTAAECCRLAPYSFELKAPPGTYVLRVFAADQSDGESRGEMEDTKRITIK